MNNVEIGLRINPSYPNVYSTTTFPTKISFKNGYSKTGYFQFTRLSPQLEKENKFTFVEFGENAQRFRATGDDKYITVVNGDDIENVEYASELKAKLAEIKKNITEAKDKDWSSYKEGWISSIKDLFSTIQYKWLDEYSELNLIEFSYLPVEKSDAYVGKYMVMILEMNFPNGRSIVLDPVAAVTSEYDGRLDLYMVGNIDKGVSILRKVLSPSQVGWILARSNDSYNQIPFTKLSLENIINEWLK